FPAHPKGRNMNRVILAIFLGLSLAGCSRNAGNTDDEGAGTRGGGDACELDYHAQLNTAFVWLKTDGIKGLTDEQKRTVGALTQKALDEIEVHCAEENLVIDRQPKTAVTSAAEGKTLTRIDSRRW